MKRNNAKPIGRFVSIAGYTKMQRTEAAFACEKGDKMVNHPSPDDPRWTQEGDAVCQRKNGSFFIHRLIMDKDGEPTGSVKIDLTRQQALIWWLRHFPRKDNEDVSDYIKKTIPKELRPGLWDDLDLTKQYTVPSKRLD